MTAFFAEDSNHQIAGCVDDLRLTTKAFFTIYKGPKLYNALHTVEVPATGGFHLGYKVDPT